jgi:hypothetical protein
MVLKRLHTCSLHGFNGLGMILGQACGLSNCKQFLQNLSFIKLNTLLKFIVQCMFINLTRSIAILLDKGFNRFLNLILCGI